MSSVISFFFSVAISFLVFSVSVVFHVAPSTVSKINVGFLVKLTIIIQFQKKLNLSGYCRNTGSVICLQQKLPNYILLLTYYLAGCYILFSFLQTQPF